MMKKKIVLTNEFNEVTPEKLAQLYEQAMAAAIKPKQTVKIHTVRNAADLQRSDVQMIQKIANEAATAETKEEAIISVAVAVGYANAMHQHGLITFEELNNLANMLGSLGEDTVKSIEDRERPILSRHFRKKVQAWH